MSILADFSLKYENKNKKWKWLYHIIKAYHIVNITLNYIAFPHDALLLGHPVYPLI